VYTTMLSMQTIVCMCCTVCLSGLIAFLYWPRKAKVPKVAEPEKTVAGIIDEIACASFKGTYSDGNDTTLYVLPGAGCSATGLIAGPLAAEVTGMSTLDYLSVDMNFDSGTLWYRRADSIVPATSSKYDVRKKTLVLFGKTFTPVS
jgi:hypothetical protein